MRYEDCTSRCHYRGRDGTVMNLDNTLAIVLAGGTEAQLVPLTRCRAKAAIPFAGQYRLIDFALSNCLHSGLRRIYVLTDPKSLSLHRHLREAWKASEKRFGSMITGIPAQEHSKDCWYFGTVDLLSQNIDLIRCSGAKNVIVLSGDQVYRMDYGEMISRHEETDAQVTVAWRAPGIASHRLVQLMGIIVFSTDVLCRVLASQCRNGVCGHDLQDDLILPLIRAGRVSGYCFSQPQSRFRYWREMRSLDAYYAANMELLQLLPPIDLQAWDWPMLVQAAPALPVRIGKDLYGLEGEVRDSIVSNGVVVSGGVVEHSILSTGVAIDSGAIVENSILMAGVQIGEAAVLRNCVIDEGVRVPAGERIGMDAVSDRRRFSVSESGVVVVPKGYRFAGTSDRWTERLWGSQDLQHMESGLRYLSSECFRGEMEKWQGQRFRFPDGE